MSVHGCKTPATYIPTGVVSSDVADATKAFTAVAIGYNNAPFST